MYSPRLQSRIAWVCVSAFVYAGPLEGDEPAKPEGRPGEVQSSCGSAGGCDSHRAAAYPIVGTSQISPETCEDSVIDGGFTIALKTEVSAQCACLMPLNGGDVLLIRHHIVVDGLPPWSVLVLLQSIALLV